VAWEHQSSCQASCKHHARGDAATGTRFLGSQLVRLHYEYVLQVQVQVCCAQHSLPPAGKEAVVSRVGDLKWALSTCRHAECTPNVAPLDYCTVDEAVDWAAGLPAGCGGRGNCLLLLVGPARELLLAGLVSTSLPTELPLIVRVTTIGALRLALPKGNS
jgi:hypothetical protein